jgi:hypothetical protein
LNPDLMFIPYVVLHEEQDSCGTNAPFSVRSMRSNPKVTK